jgi:hypothetical protein
MSCCGDKRRALRTRMSQPLTNQTKPLSALENSTLLTYLGDSSIVVRGEHTGHAYLFGPHGEALTVDGRDVPRLIVSGWFRKV